MVMLTKLTAVEFEKSVVQCTMYIVHVYFGFQPTTNTTSPHFLLFVPCLYHAALSFPGTIEDLHFISERDVPSDVSSPETGIAKSEIDMIMPGLSYGLVDDQIKKYDMFNVFVKIEHVKCPRQS